MTGSGATAHARRRALRAAGTLVFGWGALRVAHAAASIVGVRLWPAADYTRITIESERPIAARHRLDADGRLLEIDLDDVDLVAPLREIAGKVRADDPFVAAARAEVAAARGVRLRVDLKQPVRPQQLALEPVAAYRHRLVFDLHPLEPPDPLLTLLRDLEAAEQRAARTVDDVLGEWIARLEQPAPAASDPVAVPPRPAVALQTPAPSPPPTAAERRRVDRLVIVALDPGHGGEDPGAIGPGGLREKDVVLAIALQLRDRLNAVSGMRVMMTRDADFFVPLRERVAKARRVQADLFVSIHADAAYRPEARGASVYALSTGAASSTTARLMADKENAADLVGGVDVPAARDAQVLRAMLDMSTAAQIKDSLALGREVLDRMGRVGRLHKRGVEQAGFAVLKAPDIPSILVETAFISNPEEEARLRDPEYRRQIVDALATGIRRYFARNPPLARQRPI
ncbi:MAG: N-acetylmuramoyl-L-alanine amidase [Rubrivivax sp.]|nr:N-acetylmuramoyl-L-alanine amidase [Rubrivivax sp.]